MSGWGGAWSSQLVVARQVIIEGPSGELLVYSGTPALGNLIGSIAGVAGTDVVGNAFLANQVAYEQSGPFFFAAQLGAPAPGFPSGVHFYSATSAAGPWTLRADIDADQFGNLSIEPTAGGLLQTAFGGLLVQPGGSIPRSNGWSYIGDPGNPAFSSADWTNRGPGRIDAAFRAEWDYGMVSVVGDVSSVAGASATIFTLPAAFAPVSNQVLPAWNESAGSACSCLVLTSGAVSVSPFTAGDNYDIGIRYSMNV